MSAPRIREVTLIAAKADEPRRTSGSWRLYVVCNAYAIVLVLVPIVVIGLAADGFAEDVSTTLYFGTLASLLVLYNWRLDRRRRANYAGMITASRQPCAKTLLPQQAPLRKFLLRRIPMIAVLLVLGFRVPTFRALAEAFIPWLIAMAAIAAISWHMDVPVLVGTDDGLLTRRYGLIPWSEITDLRLVKASRTRILQIWVLHRVEFELQAGASRTRVGRAMEAFVQRRNAPLARLYESTLNVDLAEYREKLEVAAGRSLRDPAV
jgi:hypothetical protein